MHMHIHLYRYTSGGGSVATCQDSSCTVLPGSAPVSYTDVESGSSTALEDAVTQQPVSGSERFRCTCALVCVFFLRWHIS